MARNYNKYKKYRKKTISPWVIVILIALLLIIMSVGYASHTESLFIMGEANAKYEVYTITYVLDGGTNPEGAPVEYTLAEEKPFPIPIKSDGYRFVGWYNNKDFLGSKIVTTKGLMGNITLYAKWKYIDYGNPQFYEAGPYVFTGSNYIDTGVYLFAEENLHDNFIISFDIDEVSSTNNENHAALMNSMNESKDPYYGCVVKVSGTAPNQKIYLQSNSNTNTNGDVYPPSGVKNIRIIRINDKLYYSFDGATCIQINDFTGFTKAFDIPVTFGASIDENLNMYRYFTGTLSNMSVQLLPDTAEIDDYNPQPQSIMMEKYRHDGPVVFDGTNYINTGVSLFTSDSIDKNFSIRFTIDEASEDNPNQSTIINAKDEGQNNVWPGFVYRYYAVNTTIRFEARGGSGSGNTTNATKIQDVLIERIDRIMYLTINGGTKMKVYDYSSFTNYFDVPVTIGSSLNGSRQPFRFFKGTLSNIVIEVEEPL